MKRLTDLLYDYHGASDKDAAGAFADGLKPVLRRWRSVSTWNLSLRVSPKEKAR